MFKFLDAFRSEDHQIDWYVEQFLKGNYRFASVEE